MGVRCREQQNQYKLVQVRNPLPRHNFITNTHYFAYHLYSFLGRSYQHPSALNRRLLSTLYMQPLKICWLPLSPLPKLVGWELLSPKTQISQKSDFYKSLALFAHCNANPATRAWWERPSSSSDTPPWFYSLKIGRAHV